MIPNDDSPVGFFYPTLTLYDGSLYCSGEKTFCGKIFSSNTDTKQHMRVYVQAGEKPFKYELCRQRLHRKGTLRIIKSDILGNQHQDDELL